MTKVDDRRQARYLARRFLWNESSNRRVRSCGRCVVAGGESVGIRVSDGRVSFSGLQSCGSSTSCPACSAKIAAERQAEVTAGVAAWTAAGNSVGFITLTMRHRKRHGLDKLWDSMSGAWHDVASRAAWKHDRDLFDVEGFVRVVEATHGDEFGWHLHIHALVFLRGVRSDATVDELGRAMFARWRTSLKSAGLPAPIRDRGGLEAHLVTGDAATQLGDYFTKATYDGPTAAGFELARADLKEARFGNRTPFAILAGLVGGEAGAFERGDLELWHAWERISKGRRMISWSRGLRDTLGLGAVRSDEDIAADEYGDVKDTVAWLDSVAFGDVLRRRRDLVLLRLSGLPDAGLLVLNKLDEWGYDRHIPLGSTRVDGLGDLNLG